MRVLFAFDKFKDALSAPAACEAAAAGLNEAQPGWERDLCPLTDGGDGFAAILTHAAGGELFPIAATGPRGRTASAHYGLVAAARLPASLQEARRAGGEVAIIEMAQASGLARLQPQERDPWLTSTRGTGEMVAEAIARGVSGILLGIGGSATHDLGCGALAALGWRFESRAGVEIDPVPARWREIVRVIAPDRPEFPTLAIACDVTNPLLGTTGAAAVFAGQKGLVPTDLARLEAETERMSMLLCAATNTPPELREVPGIGAAGGIAFGLKCVTRARLVPGFELVADWVGLDAKIAAADFVLTGEGRFDAGSFSGKGPGGVAQRAVQARKHVHIFAGSADANLPGATMHVITPPATPPAAALRDTAENLRRAVAATFQSAK